MRELVLRSTPYADLFLELFHRTWQQAIGDLNTHGTFRAGPSDPMPGYSAAPIWTPLLSAAADLYEDSHGYAGHDAGLRHGLLYCAQGPEMLWPSRNADMVEFYGVPVGLAVVSDTVLHGGDEHSGMIMVCRGHTFPDIGSTVRVVLR